LARYLQSEKCEFHHKIILFNTLEQSNLWQHNFSTSHQKVIFDRLENLDKKKEKKP